MKKLILVTLMVLTTFSFSEVWIFMKVKSFRRGVNCALLYTEAKTVAPALKRVLVEYGRVHFVFDNDPSLRELIGLLRVKRHHTCIVE